MLAINLIKWISVSIGKLEYGEKLSEPQLQQLGTRVMHFTMHHFDDLLAQLNFTRDAYLLCHART